MYTSGVSEKSYMKRELLVAIILLGGLLAGGVLTGCQNIDLPVGVGEATPTPVPTVTGDTALNVEGRLVPNEYVIISFNMSGVIAEVLVAEGETIEAGALNRASGST